jgi:PhoH-like ATPase
VKVKSSVKSSSSSSKSVPAFSKIKIIDTNVFLSDPKALFSFPNEVLVIPISVIEEIDEFKKGLNELGRNAREVLRKIDKLRKRGKISATDALGIELNNKGRLIIELNHISEVPAGLSPDKVDNRLLAVGLAYRKQHPKAEVTLISKDANLRIKADAMGLLAVDYESSNTKTPDNFYKGYQEIIMPDADIKEFLKRKRLDFLNEQGLQPNEYALISSSENENLNAVARFDAKSNQLVELLSAGDVFGLEALNTEQKIALDLLLNPDIPLVTVTGKAGTGKTLLAVAAGLHQTVEENHYRKLLVSRPVFPMGKDIGFLPGTVEEKLNPWMQPIFDNLEFLFSLGDGEGKKQVRMVDRKRHEELINQGILQVEPLTYIRGRSIPQQYMIVDEAQNLTLHEIKTIVTRAGKGTKIILTGDPEQIDNPYIDSQSNGLTQIVERLKDDGLTGHVHLIHGERSELAEMTSNKLA